MYQNDRTEIETLKINGELTDAIWLTSTRYAFDDYFIMMASNRMTISVSAKRLSRNILSRVRVLYSTSTFWRKYQKNNRVVRLEKYRDKHKRLFDKCCTHTNILLVMITNQSIETDLLFGVWWKSRKYCVCIAASFTMSCTISGYFNPIQKCQQQRKSECLSFGHNALFNIHDRNRWLFPWKRRKACWQKSWSVLIRGIAQ